MKNIRLVSFTLTLCLLVAVGASALDCRTGEQRIGKGDIVIVANVIEKTQVLSVCSLRAENITVYYPAGWRIGTVSEQNNAANLAYQSFFFTLTQGSTVTRSGFLRFVGTSNFILYQLANANPTNSVVWRPNNGVYALSSVEPLAEPTAEELSVLKNSR